MKEVEGEGKTGRKGEGNCVMAVGCCSCYVDLFDLQAHDSFKLCDVQPARAMRC